jgi:hypothetical protein
MQGYHEEGYPVDGGSLKSGYIRKLIAQNKFEIDKIKHYSDSLTNVYGPQRQYISRSHPHYELTERQRYALWDLNLSLKEQQTLRELAALAKQHLIENPPPAEAEPIQPDVEQLIHDFQDDNYIEVQPETFEWLAALGENDYHVPSVEAPKHRALTKPQQAVEIANYNSKARTFKSLMENVHKAQAAKATKHNIFAALKKQTTRAKSDKAKYNEAIDQFNKARRFELQRYDDQLKAIRTPGIKGKNGKRLLNAEKEHLIQEAILIRNRSIDKRRAQLDRKLEKLGIAQKNPRTKLRTIETGYGLD